MISENEIDELIENLLSSKQLKEGSLEPYCILDGARDEVIFSKINELNVPSCCLYSGTLSPELAATAPYLVQLQKDGTFIRWLFKEGWGKSWGVFLFSQSGLNELRKHFRRFLMVKTEEGDELYFRYYDPRILRVYLPACNEEELNYVFGTVTSFITESDIANKYFQFDYNKNKLVQSTKLFLI